MNWFLAWLLSALLLLGLQNILPGIYVANFMTGLVAAAVIGLVTLLLKPLLGLLTLPINILTFGIFSFFINALLFWLASLFVPGFQVTSLLSALLASLIYGLFCGLLYR